MADGSERLDEVTGALQEGQPSPEMTVRALLGWFGAERRGVHVVSEIRRQLKKRRITTVPDFEEVWLDAYVRLVLADGGEGQTAGAAATPSGRGANGRNAEFALRSGEPDTSTANDPVQRIGRLRAANRGVQAVAPGEPVGVAIAQMMLKNYSQIPVIHGGRECKGAVTWQSIATRMVLDQAPSLVDECLESVEVVDPDARLFKVIPKIIEAGFVLVRGRDRTIAGIVTPADLSEQFRLLSEPFLLLGQIENHLRIILQRHLTAEEILAARHPRDEARVVSDISDLSFGEYVRLLEPAAMWPRLQFKLIDRGPFIDALKRVRQVRNAVMHFDPDGVGDSDLEILREFARMVDLLAAR
jgi:CBS domain-containing protein